MFVNIAMKMTKNFYRYVALGLACTYAIQVFLTIGGSMKMIPMTGVTLPFVSSGGSSMLSTLIMFSVIQGLYILRKDEDDSFEDEEYYYYVRAIPKVTVEEEEFNVTQITVPSHRFSLKRKEHKEQDKEKGEEI